MRLAAVILLFKEQSFIEACVRAIYPVVDSICCVSQHDRNFSGQPLGPDQSLDVLLSVPDPENKLRLVIRRDLDGLSGDNSEARLRNAAMALDAEADYYLIVDSDEIWTRKVLQTCWDEVQRTQWSAYRVSSYSYFRQWNYRIVEPGDGYRPLVFIRRGFPFKADRQIDWHAPARWKEYLRKGRKPKTVYLPPELHLHHGNSVGDDARMLTKILNWGHKQDVDPEWFERVWKNFHPGIRDFHYFRNRGSLYESLVTIPTPELPEEIRRCTWPVGWIEPSGQASD